MRVYIDADVLIWHLRGLPEAMGMLRSLRNSDDEMWMSAAQRIEILFHLRPGEEAGAASLLDGFGMEPITKQVVDTAARLFRRWNPSHGVGQNDAILAATAMLTGGRIITQNVKHFPMPDVRVERGWEVAS